MASNRFWAESTLEPKRQHRWLLYILGTDSGSKLPAYVVKKVDKPRIEVNETEHKFFGHSFFYPGHVTWQDVSVTLVDPINPDTSNRLYKAIQAAGYQPPTERLGDAPFTVSKAKATNNLGGQIRLEQLDPDSKPIERWTLYSPWIKNVEWGSLDYTSDDMVEINVTFRYDYARHTKLG